MKALFIISISVITYTYLVYPLLIGMWAAVRRRRIEKQYVWRPVSIVLAVHNEEANIRARIDNLLHQDYPPELVELIVVSDGSTDGTVAAAGEAGGERTKILAEEAACGKAAAVTLGVRHASHDIIVFADARQRFADNALAELTAVFHDEGVGAASGELLFENEDGGEVGRGVGMYWRYEKFIRRMESAVDSVVGATGSIYAVRRKLVAPLPPHTLLDDLLIPMRVVLRGFRVVFVRSANAYDRVSKTASDEFPRKVRTLAGNFQAFALEPALLNPLKNRLFFQVLSHKVLRLFVPYFCILALFANFFLDGALYETVLVAQLLFYGTMLLGFTPLKRARVGGVIRMVWTFGVLNAAAVAGLCVFLRGKEKQVWKTQGTSDASGGKRSSPNTGS